MAVYQHGATVSCPELAELIKKIAGQRRHPLGKSSDAREEMGPVHYHKKLWLRDMHTLEHGLGQTWSH